MKFQLKNNYLKLITIFPLLLVVFYQLLTANAQTSNSQVILTWQAHNFYPADYSGKALPANGTQISAAVELIKDRKRVDLSKANFIWYLDEKFFKRGEGIKEISFTASKFDGDTHSLRVKIETAAGNYEAAKRIPIIAPEAVIVSPYPENTAPFGEKATFHAFPYFFNVRSADDLSFAWQINAEKIAAGKDNELILNIGSAEESASQISITATVSNVIKALEVASARLNLALK